VPDQEHGGAAVGEELGIVLLARVGEIALLVHVAPDLERLVHFGAVIGGLVGGQPDEGVGVGAEHQLREPDERHPAARVGALNGVMPAALSLSQSAISSSQVLGGALMPAFSKS